MKKRFMAILAAGLVFSSVATATSYPQRPIKLIIGYSPGGAADAVARIYSAALADKLGQPVMVENRPGAGSTIASAAIAKAEPDGYTLGMASGTLYGIDKYVYNVSYTPDDFTPIMRLSMSPLILAVGPGSDVNTFKEFFDKARANPGKMFYSSSGIGGSPQTAALILENAIGTRFTHVPYKGGNPALLAVAAGDVDFSFGTAASVLPLGLGGKVKMLGVSSAQPSKIAPGVPTIAEQGLPGFEFTFWFGLFGPAGLPVEIRDKVAKASMEILNEPGIQERMVKAGNDAAPMASPEVFEQWARQNGAFALERLESTGAKPN